MSRWDDRRNPLLPAGRHGAVLLLFLLFFFILTAANVSALQKDLIINADSISYEDDIIRAEGSVEATFKDIKILGDRMVYNLDDRTVILDKGFVFYYGDIKLKGEEIKYDLDEDKGWGKKVVVNYENVNIEGSRLNFDRQEIKLNIASFDTCGVKPVPHYKISAQQISLFPKSNWLVVFWGIFWFDRIPTLPIPVYVYDVEAERKGQHNILPYPEIGSNDEDGFFVNERIIWYARRELSGSFNINYAEKKGMGTGAEANYILNKDNQGNMRLYGNYHEPFWGGITHHYYFGPTFMEEFLPSDIFSAVTFRQLDLETNLTLRERINYEKVTKFPEIFLKFRNPRFKIGGGVISENSKEAIGKFNTSLLLEHDLVKTDGFTVTPSLLLDYSRYTKGRFWFKNIGAITAKKDWSGFLSTSVGYSHYFDNQGQSPFLYEMYRFVSSDQFHSGLQLTFNKSIFKVEAVHNMPGWNLYDIDYTFEAGIHCYSFGIRHRVMRREFNLIFRIL